MSGPARPERGLRSKRTTGPPAPPGGDRNDLDPRPPQRGDRPRRRRRPCAGPQALPRPRRHRRRPADGGARRLRRDHRPALGAAGPAHLDGQPPVDADRVHPGLRRPPAAGWPHRRLPRPQAHVRHQPDRLRRGVGPRRAGAELGHAVRRPRPAGCVRRDHGAGRTVAAHRGLHRAQGAGPGLRRLRRHRRRRRRHRPHPRRRPHRVRLVALDAADQRAHRRSSPPLAALRVVTREPRRRRSHGYDIPGAVTVTGGLLALVYGFTKAGSDGWASSTHARRSSPPRPCLLAAVRARSSAGASTRCCPCGSCCDRNRGGSFLASLLVGTALFGHVPVPDLLLPGHAALLGPEERLRLPALLRSASSPGRRLASRLLPRFGPRLVMVGGLVLGSGRAGPVHHARRHSTYVVDRAAGRAHHQPRHGHGLRLPEQHRPDRR